MQNEHPNLNVMRSALNAFRSGDIAALSQLFSPGVIWRVPGRSPLAGTYTGQGEVFAFFGRLMESTTGTFRVDSIDMLANDNGGVFIDDILAERNGKSLKVRLLLHVTIRNQQIVEGFDCFHQENLWDDFWND